MLLLWPTPSLEQLRMAAVLSPSITRLTSFISFMRFFVKMHCAAPLSISTISASPEP